LEKLVQDKSLARDIMEVSKEVNRFIFYNNSLDIGIKYTPQDLKFTDMLLYSWIKDGLNGRKN
jgi:hypothetical protein